MKLESPYNDKDADFVRSITKDKYANTQQRSLGLVMRRELLLWRRDKYQIKAKLGQSRSTALLTIFKSLKVLHIPRRFQISSWQLWLERSFGLRTRTRSLVSCSKRCSSTFLVSLEFDVVRHANQFLIFFLCIGAMLLIVKQFPARAVFYKQQDANFFPTWTYVVGRSVANIPNSLIDSLLFGTIVYWFVGLAFGDGATIGNFFMFLLITFMTSFTCGLIFGIFPAVVSCSPTRKSSLAQVLFP